MTQANAQLVVIDYLRQAARTPLLVSNRIYTRVPAGPTWPLVRIRRTGGRARIPHVMDGARLQIDSWADTDWDAWEVAAAIQADLQDAEEWQHDDAVIKYVSEVLGPLPQPDPETSRARYLHDVHVYLVTRDRT